jgi:hypothetical protein
MRTFTPGYLSLERSHSHFCMAQKEGFERKIFWIDSAVSKKGFAQSAASNTGATALWTFGIGTVVGSAVDWSSGAMNDIKDSRILIELKPFESVTSSEKVLHRTKRAGEALVKIPKEIARETIHTVVDTSVRGTSEQIHLQPKGGLEEAESIPPPVPVRRV